MSVIKSHRYSVLIVVMLCVALAITVKAKRSISVSTESNVAPAAANSSAHEKRTQMIKFTLFPDGIFPHEVTASAGNLVLAINDKTNGSSGIVVERLSGNGSQVVGEVKRKENKSRGRELLKLTPGEYTVRDASNTSNVARLIVEP